MKKKIIRKLEKKFKNLRIAIFRILTSFNSDDIHTFRLELKKCKVFIDLANYFNKKNNKYSLPKSTRKANKILGRIRNLKIQGEKIHLEMIHYDDNSVNIYYDFLKRKEQQLKKRANKLIRHQDIFSKKISKNISAFIKKQDNITIEKFVQYQRRKLDFLILNDKKSDRDFHRIRILLKSLQYVWILVKNKPNSDVLFGVQRSNLSVLTQGLGEYHDLCIALTQLESELPFIGFNFKDREKLMEIAQKWRIEKEGMRNMITDQILQFGEFA